MEWYERIRMTRCAKHMTQDELAIKSDYGSRAAVAKIERGGVDVPVSKIVTIAKALGVSPNYILCGDNSKDFDHQLLEAYHSADDSIQEAIQSLLHLTDR